MGLNITAWREQFRVLGPVELVCQNLQEKNVDCSLCFSSNLPGDSKCRADEKMERGAWEKVLFYRNSRWPPTCHSTRISKVSVCCNQGARGFSYGDWGHELHILFSWTQKLILLRCHSFSNFFFYPTLNWKHRFHLFKCKVRVRSIAFILTSLNRNYHLYLVCVADTVLRIALELNP